MPRNIERYDVSTVVVVVEVADLFFVLRGALHIKKQDVFQKSMMTGEPGDAKAGKSIKKTGM
jgi:hypothetical protein